MRTSNRQRTLCLVILAGTFLLSHLCFGQRHRKGQFGLSAGAGILDRIPGPGGLRADQQGALLALDFVRYTRGEHYWKVGYQYDRKQYRTHGISVGVNPGEPEWVYSERHTIGADYALVSLHNYRRSYYLSPVVGLLTGLEVINGNRRNLSSGLIGARSRFTLGAGFGLEGEVFLGERLSIVAGITERWYAFSDLGRLHTQAQAGIRFTFYQLN